MTDRVQPALDPTRVVSRRRSRTTILLRTCVVGAVSLAALVSACRKPAPPVPALVLITAPSECREGETAPIKAEVRDADGGSMGSTVQWRVEPPSGGAMEGALLRCSHEGSIKLTGTAGSATATQVVTIRSPLVGTWVRRGDDKDGLAVRVEESVEGLMGYVVDAPGPGALPYLKKPGIEVAAPCALKCAREAWSPGIKKWKGARRLTSNRWSLSDLAKLVQYTTNRSGGDCRCSTKKAEFTDDYELTLVDMTHIELRDSKVGGESVQKWERLDASDAGPASSAPSDNDATAPGGGRRTVRKRCPEGLKAWAYPGGCMCAVVPARAAPWIDVPAGCDKPPTAEGSECVFQCN